MKFKVYQRPIEMDYYIVFYNNDFVQYRNDDSIAKLLDLSNKEYGKLLEKFGAIELFIGYIFNDKKDAIKCICYLNKKYLIILRLSGKI